MDENISATGGLKTALILALIQSLDSPDPKVRDNAEVAVLSLGRPQVLEVLISSMYHGSPEDKWASIRGLSVLMNRCRGPGPVRAMAKRLQEEIDRIGPSQDDRRISFVRIALTKLRDASDDIIKRKDQELRGILSEGRPKPPRINRTTPEDSRRIPSRRVSSPSIRRLGRSGLIVPRPKNH
ncbi:MAG: hypothetical protein AB1295_03480 [Candidatus Micrarchaeota archaeon]